MLLRDRVSNELLVVRVQFTHYTSAGVLVEIVRQVDALLGCRWSSTGMLLGAR
jgi:hypothetical protein